MKGLKRPAAATDTTSGPPRKQQRSAASDVGAARKRKATPDVAVEPTDKAPKQRATAKKAASSKPAAQRQHAKEKGPGSQGKAASRAGQPKQQVQAASNGAAQAGNRAQPKAPAATAKGASSKGRSKKDAAAAAAADTHPGSTQRKAKPKAGPKKPAREPLPDWPPARAVEEFYRAHEEQQLANLPKVQQEARAAAPVLTMPDGRPLWEKPAEEFPAFTSLMEIQGHFEKNAQEFEPGKEPWRRFMLEAHVMQALLEAQRPEAEAAALQQAANAYAVEQRAVKVAVKRQTAEAAEEDDCLGEGSEAAEGDNQLDEEDSSEDSGDEIDPILLKGPLWGAVKRERLEEEKRIAKERKQAEKEEREKARKEMREEMRDHRYNVLTVLTEEASDPSGKLAQSFKQANQEFDAAYREAIVVNENRIRKQLPKWQRYERRLKKCKEALKRYRKDDNAPAWLVERKRELEKNKVKKPSFRPDRGAESSMLKSGRRISDRPSWGHIPGLSVNARHDLRSRATVMGSHRSPLAGIRSAQLPVTIEINGQSYKNLPAATSVVQSAIYCGNVDTTDGIVLYSGEGGVDLLGNKQQISDQKLVKGNKALLVSMSLGLPVRLLRRNEDPDSSTESSVVYDGLYKVVGLVKVRLTDGRTLQNEIDAYREQQAAQQQQQQEEEEGGPQQEESQQSENQEQPSQEQEQPAEEPVGQPPAQPQQQQPQQTSQRAGKQQQASKAKQAGPAGGSKQEAAGKTKQKDEDGKDGEGGEGGETSMFIFGLKRMEGQPASESQAIIRWLKAKGARKPKHTAEMRKGAVATDISKGLEAPATICCVNEGFMDQARTKKMLPPGLHPIEDKAFLIPPPPESYQLVQNTHQPGFLYVTDHVYDGVEPPKPPKLLLEGTQEATEAERRIRQAAEDTGGHGCGSFLQGPLWDAEAVICRPEELEDDDGPHKLLARLNGGELPYAFVGDAKEKSEEKRAMIEDPQRVVIECGDWTGCTLGDECPQRQVLRPLQRTFEVYHTCTPMGWGVRCWQSLPAGTVVARMVGTIFRKAHDEEGHEVSCYEFDLAPRPDVDERGRNLTEAQKKEVAEKQHVEFTLCCKERGNFVRYINHSCEPNLWVQPVCAGHTDTRYVEIVLVAPRNIPAFEPLTYDYGPGYLEDQLGNKCCCGAATCVSKKGEAAAAGGDPTS